MRELWILHFCCQSGLGIPAHPMRVTAVIVSYLMGMERRNSKLLPLGDAEASPTHLSGANCRILTSLRANAAGG